MRYAIVTFFLLLGGCSATDPTRIYTVADFVPLKIGVYQVYSVDSTVINQNVPQDFHFEMMTMVTDSFPNSEGNYTYVIQRSRRQDANSAWVALESWSIRLTEFQAVVYEGNVPYVKVAGPPGEAVSWNGNSYNTLGGTEKCLDNDSYGCDIYEMIDYKKSVEVASGEKFEITLKVLQNNNQDPIVANDVRSETYAYQVGMILKSVSQLNYCTDNDCVGTQFVNSGLVYTLSIIDHGGF